jgi:protein tyrosine phosphatase (PTP) superfamily phosphohydrolase (DUF442 family)
MLIIIDYDDTFTASPIFWSDFIQRAQEQGYATIICCTNRIEDPRWPFVNEDVKEDMDALGVPIVFSGTFKDKWTAVLEAGYNPQNAIWIDDKPGWIIGL